MMIDEINQKKFLKQQKSSFCKIFCNKYHDKKNANFDEIAPISDFRNTSSSVKKTSTWRFLEEIF